MTSFSAGPLSDGDIGTAPPVDLLGGSFDGDELHRLLERHRSGGLGRLVSLAGMPAVLVASHALVREFLAAQEVFPGGAIYRLSTEPHIGDTLINRDGPDHTAARNLATPAFRSRATARFVDEQLEPLAHEVIDRFAGQGSADLAGVYAQVLPFWAISRKLGLPVGSEERQRRWALAMLSYPTDPTGARAAVAEVTEFLQPIVEDRRRNPADDVISQLLTGEFRGTAFSDEEVYAHVRLLYAVGATTTSDALSTVLHHLLSRPELTRRVRADRSLVPALVQECLRFEPPVANLPRLAPDGGTLGEVDLSPGTLVVCSLAGANRDPAVFDRPHHFDIDRTDQDVLSFGFGTKYCPGSHLARQQLATAVEVVLDRLPELELVSGDAPSGGVLRRCERLDATWRPDLSP